MVLSLTELLSQWKNIKLRVKIKIIQVVLSAKINKEQTLFVQQNTDNHDNILLKVVMLVPKTQWATVQYSQELKGKIVSLDRTQQIGGKQTSDRVAMVKGLSFIS